nr:MAG TPA: hypothetical protein [Caudoviricetes sp.]
MENKPFDFHEIKTFEDACRHLGISENTELLVTHSYDTEAFLQGNALYKLMIIQKAINNDKWFDKDGFGYYPVFMLISKEEMDRLSKEEKQRKGIKQILSCAYTNYLGFLCVDHANRGCYAYSDYGAPFCFNSKEAALYVGHQFEDLFLQYYGIKYK